MVAPSGVKFCMMVHVGPGQIFSHSGGSIAGIPKSKSLGLNLDHFTTNMSNSKSQRYMSARA